MLDLNIYLSLLKLFLAIDAAQIHLSFQCRMLAGMLSKIALFNGSDMQHAILNLDTYTMM